MVFIGLLPFVWFTFIGFDSRNGTKLLTKQTMKKIDELPCNIHPIEKEKGMNRLTKLFLLCAICTLVSMALRNANAFIFFCSLADAFGVWVIVKHFKTNEI